MKVISTRSEKLLYYMIGMIFYCFKSIGLAPFSLDTKTPVENSNSSSIRACRFSKIGTFYNIVLLVLFVIMDTLLFLSMISLSTEDKGSSTSLVIDLIRYSFFVCTTWFLILYWTLRQKQAADIMNRLLDVHRILFAPKDQLSNARMVLFLAVHMTFNVSVWITSEVLAVVAFDSFWTMIPYNKPQLIVHLLFVEYSMVLGLLAREFENVNENLLALKEFPDYLVHRPLLPNYHLAITILPTNNHLVAIKLLHNVRTTLYEVSRDVADFFSLPILFSVASTSFALINSCYYIVISAFGQFPDKQAIIQIYDRIWVVVCLYPLILLAFNVTKTTKKAKLTKQLVHKLLATAKKREVIAELEQFSLELIHENLSFTAYGFFELDFTLIQSILGATATYIIIIVQFYLQSNTT